MQGGPTFSRSDLGAGLGRIIVACANIGHSRAWMEIPRKIKAPSANYDLWRPIRRDMVQLAKNAEIDLYPAGKAAQGHHTTAVA
jgi:hypothetical protein